MECKEGSGNYDMIKQEKAMFELKSEWNKETNQVRISWKRGKRKSLNLETNLAEFPFFQEILPPFNP